MKNKWVKYAVSGLPAGFINGLFGASGGIILVFFYQKLFGMDQKEALSTALSVMPFLSVISVFYLWSSLTLPAGRLLTLCAAGIVGGTLGGVLFKRLGHKFLRRLFALFILWAAWRIYFC